MSEDIWFESVSEILSDIGMDFDEDNDGWEFMFENGFTPQQAVNEMLN